MSTEDSWLGLSLTGTHLDHIVPSYNIITELFWCNEHGNLKLTRSILAVTMQLAVGNIIIIVSLVV